MLTTAADIVADPSAPDAFVNGIMEGKEWVWDNGLLKEKEVAKYQSYMDEATRAPWKRERSKSLSISSQIFDSINKLRLIIRKLRGKLKCQIC